MLRELSLVGPWQGEWCSGSALTAAIALAVVVAWPASAQDLAEFTRCRSIANDGERLGCYDRLVGPAGQTLSAASPGYQAMSLTDVKLDQDGLRGHEMEVSGNLVAANAIALLRSGDTDTSPLIVDFKAVPREQRRALLEHCEASGCLVTIRSRVDRVMAQPGIVGTVKLAAGRLARCGRAE